ncbi:MAG TPA: winged helix-turn-helix domain-containing protein [Candidatus Paceibacterota bacterium]|jgi:DNA-binding response OmpR family regulator
MGMENLLHKLEAGANRPPTYGPISLDIESKTVSFNGAERTEQLTKSEYQVLWLLVRAQGNSITEGEIFGFLYEDYPDHKDLPLSNTTVVFINKLRHKLQELTDGKVVIQNQHGFGYYLQVYD